jgi:hypothetical protein
MAKRLAPLWFTTSSDGHLNRLLGWWYICIGLAFVALAARAFVAVGFGLLGIAELWRL